MNDKSKEIDLTSTELTNEQEHAFKLLYMVSGHTYDRQAKWNECTSNIPNSFKLSSKSKMTLRNTIKI